MRRTIGLVVFAFIAVLLIDAFGFRALWPDREDVPALRVQIDMLAVALDHFRRDVGRYPTSDEGLRALWQRPADLASWRGPYVTKDVPPDSWGRPFIYRSTGQDYELSSLGADGKARRDRHRHRLRPVLVARLAAAVVAGPRCL